MIVVITKCLSLNSAVRIPDNVAKCFNFLTGCYAPRHQPLDYLSVQAKPVLATWLFSLQPLPPDNSNLIREES